MAYEPSGRVKPFIDAVRREPTRIWKPAEVAVLIGCPQSSVGSWLDYSLKQKAVYRGKQHGQVVYAGQPFPPEAAYPHPAERNAATAPTPAPAPVADLRVPRFGEAWTPPKMTAPRPGSDVPVPSRAPGAPPAACDTGRRSTSAATASGHELPDDTAAAAASLSVANGGDARVASAGCAHQSAPAQITVHTVLEGLGSTVSEIRSAVAPVPQITPVPPVETAEEDAEETVEPNAFVDIGSGDVILVGCEVDEDGRVTVPSDLVRKIIGRMAWSPMR